MGWRELTHQLGPEESSVSRAVSVPPRAPGLAMEELSQWSMISGPPPVLKQHNAPPQPQASGGSSNSDSGGDAAVLGTTLGLMNPLRGSRRPASEGRQSGGAAPCPQALLAPGTPDGALRPRRMVPPGQPSGGLNLCPDDLRKVRVPRPCLPCSHPVPRCAWLKRFRPCSCLSSSHSPTQHETLPWPAHSGRPVVAKETGAPSPTPGHARPGSEPGGGPWRGECLGGLSWPPPWRQAGPPQAVSLQSMETCLSPGLTVRNTIRQSTLLSAALGPGIRGLAAPRAQH